MKKYLENIRPDENITITFVGSNESLRIEQPRVEGEFLEGVYKYSESYPDIIDGRAIMIHNHFEEVIAVRIDSITSVRRAVK